MAGEELTAGAVEARAAGSRRARTAVPALRSLSAQLLLVTIAFVFVAEAMIFLPSVARERLAYLEARIMDADLATLSLEETPDNMVSDELARRLLDIAGVRAIVYRGGQTRRLVLADTLPSALDYTTDLRDAQWTNSVRDAFATMFRARDQVFRLIGPSRQSPGALVEVVMDEAPMAEHLRTYAWRILFISALVSMLTAVLVFLTLQWRLVAPMRRVTRSMIAFRTNPEDPTSVLTPTWRNDEIAVAERELSAMQTDLRAALRQNQRLVELGTAVSKIHHDLRNILATAVLVSDHIARIEDPEVRRLTPRLVKAIDRAIGLCDNTLRYGRADEAPPDIREFELHGLVDEVTAFVAPGSIPRSVEVRNLVAEPFAVRADREQIFRALLNLARNAVQAMTDGSSAGTLIVAANRAGPRVQIDVDDTGPGLPKGASTSLFRPFANSRNTGGTGLGLAIVRDIARCHGGDVALVHTGADGTRFRIVLPHA